MGNFQKDKGVVGRPHPSALLRTEPKVGQSEWTAAIATHIILAKGTHMHMTHACAHTRRTPTHTPRMWRKLCLQPGLIRHGRVLRQIPFPIFQNKMSPLPLGALNQCANG